MPSPAEQLPSAGQGQAAAVPNTPNESRSGGSPLSMETTPREASRLGANLLSQAQAAHGKGDNAKAFALAADALTLSRKFSDDPECQKLGTQCEMLLKSVTAQLKPAGAQGADRGRALIEK